MAEEPRAASARRRMAEAGVRAVRASMRVTELQALSDRLDSGEPLTEADLTQAQAAAAESAEDARVARTRERDELVRSAKTHRRAAALLRDLERPDEANDHRKAAESDERTARELEGEL